MKSDVLLIIISVVVFLYGYYHYLSDTIKGLTKPNRMSQLCWSIGALVAAGAAISSNAEWNSVIPTLLTGIISLIIFIVSFLNKQAYWKTTRIDYTCGAFSIVAMLLWLVVDLPTYAIWFAILSDFAATAPTIGKSLMDPESETGKAYILEWMSIVIVLPTIKSIDIQDTAYTFYLLLSNFIIIFSIYRYRLYNFYRNKLRIPLRSKLIIKKFITK